MMLHYYFDQQGQREAGKEHDDSAGAQSIANLYSWSIALSFIALDLIILSHRSFVANLSRFRNSGQECALMPTLVSILDFGLIAF